MNDRTVMIAGLLLLTVSLAAALGADAHQCIGPLYLGSNGHLHVLC